MESPFELEGKRIERVILACSQCRGRHVKCDATQPSCLRCKRDGKECTYKKSRRGGLDKAALARRKLRLQQEAERVHLDGLQDGLHNDSTVDGAHEHQLPGKSSPSDDPDLSGVPIDFLSTNISRNTEIQYLDSSLAFHANPDRLLEVFFESFWPSLPAVLPLHHLQWRQSRDGHGMEVLLLVLQYIGAIYAPWTSAEPYRVTALHALSCPFLPHTAFNVQALMLFAVAAYHSDYKQDAQNRLNLAVKIALELGMNKQAFAQAYGEADPVLEESWRRTFYFLLVADQHFAVHSNVPLFALANIPNTVDLPCDDEYFESGLIPPVMTMQDYENRELSDLEIVFSSIVYLYDLHRIVKAMMDMFLEVGTFGEAMIEQHDTKLAIWASLLPACKKDPLQKDGTIDEIMFTAHMIATIATNGVHRPFSSLVMCPEEITTKSFLPSVIFLAPPQQPGRAAHTARVLKASEMHTKLLAIPCTIERHNVFTMYMVARLATTQISACKYLLEDRALAIARDRIRLSIGFLKAMGSIWPLGKMMAKEVSYIARMNLSKCRNTVTMAPEPTLEIDLPRDELIWPVDPSAQIDIFSGLMLPIDWETTSCSYSSSTPSHIP